MSDSGISFSGTTMRSDSPGVPMHQHPRPSLKPSVSMNALRPPIPIDKAACISLVISALKAAREEITAEREARGRGNNSPDPGGIQYPRPGVTINLSHQKIASIPLEVLELIKDEIERLALAHNQLTSFSNAFSNLPRLRYLNLRSNFLKEFPPALTRLPSLEILDVSRNRLRSLPPSFGKLMSLKVLSMSKNKINVLPTYIGDMSELKILKLDHNPILFPPKEVLENEEADRDAWLENVKRFLKQQTEKSNTSLDTESGSSSDEGGGDNDYSSINTTLVGKPSVESFHDRSDSLVATIKPHKPAGDPGILPFREGIQKRNGTLPRRPKHLLQQIPATMPNSPLKSPAMPLTPLSATERSRSNSESIVQTNRGSRRMGMVGTHRELTNIAAERLRTVDEQKQAKHQRGYSHDSAAFDSAQRSGRNGSSRSPTERQPGPYFRRLSSLPENKRSSLSSARVGEAARGILYAMSTLQGPIEEFVQSFGDPNGPHNKVEIALYNGNIHIGSLVGALEAYEEKDDESAVDQVIDTCYSCVAAFRQVLAMLQTTVRDIGAGIIGPDARYIRTLLLMVYGSYVEIQGSYEVLRPLLISQQISENATQPFNSAHAIARHPPMPINQRLKSGSTASTTASVAASVALASQMTNIPPPLPTPKHQDTFAMPPTPGLPQSTLLSAQSDGGFDRDEPLYGKIQAATNAAIVTLPVIERDIKAAVAQNLQPSTALKLREVSSLCVAGTEAARRLSKIKWEAIQDGDMNERRKFWEDTNKFTNLVINVAELIKSITQEYAFPKHILVAVGTVVRPTRELYLHMNGSGFRQPDQSQSPSQNPPGTPYSAFQSMTSGLATPLSAALGIATQATVPHGHYPGVGVGPGVGMGSRSGTLLSQTHPTMTSAVSEVGMAFGKAQTPLKSS